MGNKEDMGSSVSSKLRAVLFDRDGTLVVDVPYNGDPRLVTPMPGAKAVLDALRADGIATGVISNQSGIARGLITEAGQDTGTAGTLYRTTPMLLEKLGLQSLEELPDLAPLLPDLADLGDTDPT